MKWRRYSQCALTYRACRSLSRPMVRVINLTLKCNTSADIGIKKYNFFRRPNNNHKKANKTRLATMLLSSYRILFYRVNMQIFAISNMLKVQRRMMEVLVFPPDCGYKGKLKGSLYLLHFSLKETYISALNFMAFNIVQIFHIKSKVMVHVVIPPLGQRYYSTLDE